MGNPLRLLITGATGAVGPTLVREAISSQYLIRTLSLDQPYGLFEQDVEARQGDITNPETVYRAMQGIDLVVHLAALLHIADPPASMEEKYFRINVEGIMRLTRAVVPRMLDAGYGSIVNITSIEAHRAGPGFAVYSAMKAALANLTKEPVPYQVEKVYGGGRLRFGPEYIIPKPFDPRVLIWEASAVAQAAMETGVARLTVDIDEYRKSLRKRFLLVD